MSNEHIQYFGVGNRVALSSRGPAGTIVHLKFIRGRYHYKILPDWNFMAPELRNKLSIALGPNTTKEKAIAILPELEAAYLYPPIKEQLLPAPEKWSRSPFFLGVQAYNGDLLGRPENLTPPDLVYININGNVTDLPRNQASLCIMETTHHRVVESLGGLTLHAKNLMTPAKGEEEYVPGQKLLFVANGLRYSNGQLLPGDLLEFVDSDGGHLIVKPLGESGSGECLRVTRKSVQSFPYPWIKKGACLTIKEGVIFRKRDLRGKRAQALTHTDSGGDVGLQFEEDIGAGSLDGLGEDGKCLYLPAEKVTLL